MNWLTITIISVILLINAGYSAASPKISRRVSDRVAEKGFSDAIVLFADPYSLEPSQKDKSGRKLHKAQRKSAIKAKRDQIQKNLSLPDSALKKGYKSFPLLHVSGDSALLELIASHPDVISISENSPLKTTLTQSLPFISANTAQSRGYKGAGASVAILDTGVDYTLPAFGSCTSPGVPASCKVIQSFDAAPDDGALDDDSHGTNVAGIAAGVAPDAKLIAIDVFTGASAYYADILSALDWVYDNQDAYDIAAVNLSLGSTSYYSAYCPSDVISSAVSALKGVGVATVISSGNDAYSGGIFHQGIASPACVPDAISVGAVYDSNIGYVNYGTCTDASSQADKVTCFSQASDILKILAPGANVTAAGVTMFGTSQAAPHVTGSFALLKGAHPSISVQRGVDALLAGGVNVSDKRFTPNKTFKRLNIDSALSAFPKEEVSLNLIDFGVVPPSAAALPETVTITNSGGISLNIGSISISGANSSEFTVTSDSCSDASIPVSGSCSFTVNHTPLSTGERSASIQISSDDPDAPSFSISTSSRDKATRRVNVSINGTGFGTVTSAPFGISCPPACEADFTSGSTVILYQNTSASSVFNSWSDAGCSGAQCSLYMDSDRNISVNMSVKPAEIDGKGYFSTINDAVLSAADGDTIKIFAGGSTSVIDVTTGAAISIQGGYDNTFTSGGGVSTIYGMIQITSGSVTIDSIEIR